jgi:hypothetical protein
MSATVIMVAIIVADDNIISIIIVHIEYNN